MPVEGAAIDKRRWLFSLSPLLTTPSWKFLIEASHAAARRFSAHGSGEKPLWPIAQLLLLIHYEQNRLWFSLSDRGVLEVSLYLTA